MAAKRRLSTHRDRQASESSRDEINVVALDVGDHHDAHLGQEMERKVVVRVSEDGLLDQQHGAAGLLDLLAQPKDVLALTRPQRQQQVLVSSKDAAAA